MRSVRRYVWCALFFLGLFLILVICGAGVLFGLESYTDESSNTSHPVVLEMKLGETLDLNEYCPNWNDLVYLADGNGMTDRYTAARDDLFLDGDGFLHAKESGTYYLDIRGGRLFLLEMLRRTICPFVVIVYDAEYDDYMPVKNYDQLENGVRSGKKKFIQAGNFTLSGRNGGRLLDFEGIFINPDGYTITIRDDLPLFRQLNEGAVVSGLLVDDGGEGFRPVDEELGSRQYGMIAAGNGGVIVDCAVRADLYGGELLQEGDYTSVSGIAGSNGIVNGPSFRYATVLRCSFEGNAYRQGYPIYTTYTVYGIVCESGGIVRDCTVQANAYEQEGLSADFAFTLYHAPVPDPDAASEVFEKFAEQGNRVFDLSGKHEVDFSKPVTYTVGQNRIPDVGQVSGFRGAIVPRGLYPFLEENVWLLSVTDSEGTQYAVDEPLYFGDRDLSIHYEFRYKQTEFGRYGDGTICDIYPAEEEIVLPAGSLIGSEIGVGEYSPAEITLQFEGDALITYDAGKVSPVEYCRTFTIRADFTRSDLYFLAQDGSVLKKYGEDVMLCEFGGDLTADVVTLPAEATLSNGNPFGDASFDRLYTNNVRMFGEYANTQWARGLKEIICGAALSVGEMRFDFFFSLERISSDEREDGFYVSNGMLFEERQDGEETVAALIAAPVCYAPGGELVIENCRVDEYALHSNEAKKIVFRNVSYLEGESVWQAAAEEVVFEGTGGCEVRPYAFRACKNLRIFTAESGADVRLNGSALCGKMENLKIFTLTDGFARVSYTAVTDNSAFEGYALAEGCDKFTVVNGLYFDGGSVYIPAAWKGDTVVLPEGTNGYFSISADSPGMEIGTLQLSKDAQSVNIDGVLFGNFGVDGENGSFSVQDGVLYTADMRTLVLFPVGREGSFEVPNTVEIIASRAFFGASVREVFLPGGLTEIRDNAFRESALENIEIPAGITSIGYQAFQDSALRTVTIGDGLTQLRSDVFNRCVQLESVLLPATLQEIGISAFESCSSLTSIRFPASLQSIGESAFAETGLTTLHFGENLQMVSGYAFKDCANLLSVTAENDLTLYGYGAFDGTLVLQNPAYRYRGGIYFGDAFVQPYEDTDLLTIREGTKSVSSMGIYRVGRAEIPSSVQRIDEMAFDTPGYSTKAEIRFETPYLGNIKLYNVTVVVPENVQFTGQAVNVTFCYDGSKEDHEANGAPLSAFDQNTVYFYSETVPASGGKFWHYVAGEIAFWS